VSGENTLFITTCIEKDCTRPLILSSGCFSVFQKVALKAGCSVFFNAGCNEQVFSPKSRKKFGADPSCRFRTLTLIPKNDVQGLQKPETDF